MAPDIRKKVDAARALREAREKETKKQVEAQTAPEDVDPDKLKPIWADPPSRK
ncbi:hypothetical protein V5O48_002057 [Marasmius crinis-equi]|uniref:Uncharacterized protein n=1 Tax=Marasmius crinis-equi TaxID=585013 RepID=A0ABR3FXJ0_9AGAR